MFVVFKMNTMHLFGRSLCKPMISAARKRFKRVKVIPGILETNVHSCVNYVVFCRLIFTSAKIHIYSNCFPWHAHGFDVHVVLTAETFRLKEINTLFLPLDSFVNYCKMHTFVRSLTFCLFIISAKSKEQYIYRSVHTLVFLYVCECPCNCS